MFDWRGFSIAVALIAMMTVNCQRIESGVGDDDLQITRDGVIGSWERDDGYDILTYEFRDDGSYRFHDSSGYEREGTWSLEGNALTMDFDEEDHDGEYFYRVDSRRTELAAIVNRVLYLEVLIRTSGHGDDLDGTWRESEEGEYDYTETGPDGDYSGTGEDSYDFTGRVSNDRDFSYEVHSLGWVDEEGELDEWDERETGRGTIDETGGRIYVTIDTVEGYVTDFEPDVRTFVGWRVSDDVVVRGWSDSESLEEFGYNRLR